MSGTLYVVGTPIGNLNDFSPRAMETLKTVDFIAAEDTRVTRKLCSRFDIHTPLCSYHEHNRQQAGERIMDRLLAGETAALVTDAGMPAISDPGEDLVALCREHGVPVVAVPGPSAVITALAVSGLSCGRFTFEGFLSMNRKSRREHLEEIRCEKRTMVFYEAPHKLRSTLQDLLDVLGDRRISLVRELTKIHEEARLTTLSKAVEYYAEMSPKGEFVLIIEGAKEPEEDEDAPSLEQAAALARSLMEQGQSASSAAKEAAGRTGHKKGEIYKILCE